MAGEKLVRMMKSVSREGVESSRNTDIMFGVVTSTTPLQVKVDNRFFLDEDFLLVSNLCKQKTITLEQNGITTSVEVWRGLQVGDHVWMLRVNGGQLYYIMERSESL